MSDSKKCKTCRFRDDSGVCMNEKLAEDYGQEKTNDMLIYPYNESAGFFVGPEFGCIHHIKAVTDGS